MTSSENSKYTRCSCCSTFEPEEKVIVFHNKAECNKCKYEFLIDKLNEIDNSSWNILEKFKINDG